MGEKTKQKIHQQLSMAASKSQQPAKKKKLMPFTLALFGNQYMHNVYICIKSKPKKENVKLLPKLKF